MKKALDTYGQNLCALAEQNRLDPVVGRDNEVRRMIQILARRTKNNPVLVGVPGCGKTSLANELARRIVNKDVPDALQGCKLYALDIPALIAGASFHGQFEDRLKSVIDEVLKANPRILIFLDELHVVLGAGRTSSGNLDAAQILKPYLARGDLHCIGATTIDEYRLIEKDPAFERRFQKVVLEEPSVPETISILRGLKAKYETHHGVHIHDSAVVAAATLSSRYIQDRFQPDKSIDLIDEACAKVRCQLDSQPEEIDTLERQLLLLQVEATALAPETDAASCERLLRVQEQIAKTQDELQPLKQKFLQDRETWKHVRAAKSKIEALHAKMEAAERRKDVSLVADLKFGALPEMQRQLESARKALNGQSHEMISESVDQHSIAEIVARWTGIPVQRLTQTQTDKLLDLPNILKRRVIGQDEAIQVVSEALKRSRAGVSRTNQPVSFFFLGSSGCGKGLLAKSLALALFDNENHIVRVDCSELMEKHSVSKLIGTSPGYVGYEQGGFLTEQVRVRPYSVVLFDEVEKAHPDIAHICLQILDDGRLTDGHGRTVNFANCIVIFTSNLTRTQLKSHFRVEFINRLGDVIAFHTLNPANMRDIVKKAVQELEKRVEKVEIKIDDEALDFIAKQAYSPDSGARPTERFCDHNIGNHVADVLLKRPEGGTVSVSVKDNKLTFH